MHPISCPSPRKDMPSILTVGLCIQTRGPRHRRQHPRLICPKENVRQWEKELHPPLRVGPISTFKISPLRHCPGQCWLTTVPDPRASLFPLRKEARRLLLAQRDSFTPGICYFVPIFIYFVPAHSPLVLPGLLVPVTASLFPSAFRPPALSLCPCRWRGVRL